MDESTRGVENSSAGRYSKYYMPVRHLSKEYQFARYGISLFCHRLKVTDPLPEHSHDYAELVIITNGKADHYIDGETYHVTAGDVYIMEGNVGHCFINVENLEVINIMFDLDDLDIPIQKLNMIPDFRSIYHLEPGVRKMHKFSSRLHLDPVQLEHIEKLHDDLLFELEMRQKNTLLVLCSILVHVLAYLSWCYENLTTRRHKSLTSIGRVLNYIEANYREEITLSNLCRTAYMSESTLRRKFHETMQDTPTEYIQKFRLKKACNLLKDTDKSVTDIAFDVGFNSSNYFCRYFRKYTGQSPSEYRKDL